jgi:hypothetical protein
LELSISETHAAVRRAIRSRLLLPDSRKPDSLADIAPATPAISDLLCYGVPYFFPAEPGRLTLGVPTAESAPPLSTRLTPPPEPPYVSPCPRGTTRGLMIEPLYSSAPDAALRDPALAEWLALTDALRMGRGRVAELARNEIVHRLRPRA